MQFALTAQRRPAARKYVNRHISRTGLTARRLGLCLALGPTVHDPCDGAVTSP